MANPISGFLGRNFVYSNDTVGLNAFKAEWLTAAQNQGINIFSTDFNGTQTNYFNPIPQSNLTLSNNSWQTYGNINGMGVAASYAGWYTEISKIRAEINHNPNTGESQKLTYKWQPISSITSAFIDLSTFAPKSAEKWGDEVGFLRGFKNGQEVDLFGVRMVNESTQSSNQSSINNSQFGVKFTADDGVNGDFKFKVFGNFDELQFEASPYDNPSATQPTNQFGKTDSSDFLVQQIKYEGTEDALKVAFDSINLPDTIDFGDEGTARVTVTNQGTRAINQPVTVNLIISTDETIDRLTPETLIDAQDDLKNDGLLARVTQNVNLQPGQSTILNIPYNNLTSVVSPGAYHIIAEVDPANQLSDRNSGNNIATQLVSAPGTDVVIDWMSAFLNAVQEDPESGDPVGSAPPEGTRAAALLSAAIYDTVNAFTQTHTPYLVNQIAPVGASLEAAVTGAAHYVLTLLYPNEAAMFNLQRDRSLTEAGTSNGFDFGRSIAQAVMASPQATALSVTDPDLGYPYTAGAGDYIWHYDPLNNYAVGAGYGEDAIPFAVPDSDTFAPIFDTTFNSNQYAQEIEEVRLFGGKQNTATTTLLRTPDQTELTFFWAYDRPDTFRPYGQLIQIAQETAIREGNTIDENARLFLQLNLALADSAITAWDSKYTHNQPRPNDVIAGRIDEVTGLPVAPLAATDGRPETIADLNWESLLPTPPFPDYISGHSTFGGAFGAVMTDFFGDNYQFTAVSQELIGTTRTFSSFNQAGFEDAISRLYGGVHIREAVLDAVGTGQAIANYVVNNIAQPV
jgi:PAP2 superfamily/CARDB